MTDRKVYWLRTDDAKANALAFLQKLPVIEDKPYEVVFRRAKSQRSLAQNALYWMWVGHLSEAMSEGKDQVHLKLAYRFLPLKRFKQPIIFMGLQLAVYPKSTTELSVTEFTEYLKDIEAHAATDLHIQLPHPEEYHYAMNRGEK